MAPGFRVFAMYLQNRISRIKIAPAAGHEAPLVQLGPHGAVEQDNVLVFQSF
jgi:hypothetical protein